MMTGNEVRKSFLDFFAKKGHTIVRSAPLVPEKDPTLLFTNAGMVQFKNIFLGVEKPQSRRVADAQKCLRISGKHNDLEAVGRDTYHHTFFEMLGNWSFGDYYKKEAIEWAWELLTKVWKLPADKLWATVYKDDDDAERLWLQISGLPKERVLRFGEKENFWEMGETGPCGPCSEIHLDRGPAACDMKGVAGHTCRVNGDCARYIELWNLVFIQYNRQDDRSLEELPAKHVDTGMGLERITAVLQGVLSNYDIDIFRTIIRQIEEVVVNVGNRQKYGGKDSKEADISYRAIADHARAAAFLIADGLRPGNGDREYVLRRLIRRAARHARKLEVGAIDLLLDHACRAVVQAMGKVYNELITNAETIYEVVREEVLRFETTLVMGERFLEDAIVALQRGEYKRLTTTKDSQYETGMAETTGLVLPGEVAFKLHDTYGYPLDMTEDILMEKGMTVDRVSFDRLMEEQRSRAREARETRSYIIPGLPPGTRRFAGGVQSANDEFEGAIIDLQLPVRFIGYDRLDAESEVLGLYAAGQGKPEITEGMDEVEIITGETPFYGESGGQIGDRGTIRSAGGGLVEILDTQRPVPNLIVHRGKVIKGGLQLGDKVYLRVDPKYRQQTSLNHSATHILHAALREELGRQVHQAGSLVTPDRLRFDFNYSGPITDEKLADIEQHVNERIRSDAAVKIEETSYDDAIAKGALAFFGDKYGNVVRVVKIGEFSTELCGGTHVHNSGEIGLFKLRSESGVSAGVRRIEALTGQGALQLISNYESKLKEISEVLRTGVDDTVDRVRKLLEQQKVLEREIEALKGQLGKNQVPDLLAKKDTFKGAQYIIAEVKNFDAAQLRDTADQLKQRLGSGFVFLANTTPTNVTLVSSVTPDLTSRFHAGNIIKQVAPIVGGGGGGRPDFAQAGGKDPSKVDQALDKVREIVKAT
jgi:alanyl-tRNA synthetase